MHALTPIEHACYAFCKVAFDSPGPKAFDGVASSNVVRSQLACGGNFGSLGEGASQCESGGLFEGAYLSVTKADQVQMQVRIWFIRPKLSCERWPGKKRQRKTQTKHTQRKRHSTSMRQQQEKKRRKREKEEGKAKAEGGEKTKANKAQARRTLAAKLQRQKRLKVTARNQRAQQMQPRRRRTSHR